ncbi:MAG TPA: 2-oxo-4-hydroxy-4-carboxy-5-ureidoimidazoline decarboxylase [Candidatus Saccharimonadales bacterium]|nr:2-oxo-4-hydroxy-4-carboxy-5-ureidoimidazoline decarboxylase [Candidatus Saccharimonadales bacterium]
MSPTAAAEAFERAPVLVERLGSADGAPAEVVARARSIIATLSDPERVAILNAHPPIGATRGLSARSAAEQRATEPEGPAVLEQLARLNAAYEERFGFRFVVFVHGRTRAQIIPILTQRLERTRDEELSAGLEEFLAIAHDRLTNDRTTDRSTTEGVRR